MKKYTMSFAAAMDHKPDHPERTARRQFDWDVMFQVWPNRQSLARSIRMQERREHLPNDWHACVKLSDGEGY